MRCRNIAATGALVVLCYPLSVNAVAAHDSTGDARSDALSALIVQVEERRLWEDDYWHKLLYYRQSIFGAIESEQDDPNWFLSHNGARDPRAELIATVRSFASQEDSTTDLHPQCKFVARYSWLKSRLSFDSAAIQERECPLYKAFRANIGSDSATLVYTNPYFGSAPSIFGHILLRFNSERATGIFSYFVEYVAHTGSDRGLVYAWNGLTGGFGGFFEIGVYNEKIKRYLDEEFRDIWEYDLLLSPEEIERMVQHLWELLFSKFDYYWARENCAYRLMALLEIARPELDILSAFPVHTLPTKTARLIDDWPELIGEIRYRPSRLSLARHAFESLSRKEIQVLNALIKDHQYIFSAEFKRLPALQRARILDTYNDRVALNQPAVRKIQDTRPDDLAAVEDQLQIASRVRADILVERAALPIVPSERAIAPFTHPPHQGHETGGFQIETGVRFAPDDTSGYVQGGLKIGLHDLLDSDKGYVPWSTLNLLDTTVRYYYPVHAIGIESFTVVELASYVVSDILHSAPSWRLKVGVEPPLNTDCTLCSVFTLVGDAGFSIGITREALSFLTFGVDIRAGEALVSDFLISPLIRAGIMGALTPEWKMNLELLGTFEIPDIALFGAVSIATAYSFDAHNRLALRGSINSVGVSEIALEYLLHL